MWMQLEEVLTKRPNLLHKLGGTEGFSEELTFGVLGDAAGEGGADVAHQNSGNALAVFGVAELLDQSHAIDFSHDGIYDETVEALGISEANRILGRSARDSIDAVFVESCRQEIAQLFILVD